MKKDSLMAGSGLILSLAVFPAAAHTGVFTGHGFLLGLIHPFSGWDHLLSMIGVGFWSVFQSGKPRWALSSIFIVMMAIGASLAFSGMAVPMAETAIALSLLMMACVFAYKARVPNLPASGLVAAMAIFHGYVHAEEVASNSSVLVYSLGFLLSTTVLLVIGMLTASIGTIATSMCAKVYSFVCAMTGAFLLVGA